MHVIFKLKMFVIFVSLFLNDAYSSSRFRDELGSPPKPIQTIVFERVVEERDSFASTASGSVSGEERDSLPARPLFLDSIKAPPQLKSTVATKEATSSADAVSLDVINNVRGSLKPPSKSTTVSSDSIKANPYANILKKTSESVALTLSDSVEFSGHKSASAPPKREKAIEGRVPEADISYVGTARVVKNKK